MYSNVPFWFSERYARMGRGTLRVPPEVVPTHAQVIGGAHDGLIWPVGDEPFHRAFDPVMHEISSYEPGAPIEIAPRPAITTYRLERWIPHPMAAWVYKWVPA